MTKTIPIKTGIKALEAATGIKLSPEQINVLEYDYKTPTLTNSSAGSGKTTLITFGILLQVITGREYPQRIIGVTFSRKARLNMQIKYEQLIDKLSNLGLDYRNAPKPLFTTFHALFYHLLQKVQPVHVLPSYTYIFADLMHAMKVHSKFNSASEVLRSIFQLRSQLIDHQYSWTGLDLRGQTSNQANIQADSEELGNYHSDDFYVNYMCVVKAYLQYKKQHNLIDFNDMKVDLYKALGHADKRAVILKAMHPYRLCFIDEFQDIDPIQWQLVRKLLPKPALDRLAVVGDDDQSIYAFRGSDPNIILNLKKNVPSTKIFNLTLNYRTAENVLKSVTPLIEKNKYRLGKPLRAARKNVGKITCFKSNSHRNGGSLLLDNLSKKIHDPKIDNSKIAVLCRYNLDKTLAIDWLANQKQYIKASRNDILQNNYMYRVFYDLMKSLYTNNFSLFSKHAKRIGFYTYKKHIYWVLKYNHLSTVTKLSKYLSLARAFDSKFHDKLKSIKHGSYILRNDRNVQDAFDDIQAHIKKNVPVSGTLILGDVNDLTNYYFQFMCRHQYINQDLYSAILQYLNARMSDINDVSHFFKGEENKRDLLEHPNKGQLTKVNVITIHQSKGLQFDYVYLYNLRDLDVSDNMISINTLYAPNVTRKQFFTSLLKMPYDQLKTVDYLPKLSKEFKTAVRSNRKLLIKNKPNKDMMPNPADITINEALDHNLKDKHLQSMLDSDYNSVVAESHTVEEERRLVYVALTRTIKAAYYNDDDHMSPLLEELSIPKNNIVEMDKNHHLYTLGKKLHNSGLSSEQMNQFKSIMKGLTK